jgi:hypothetical protein
LTHTFRVTHGEYTVFGLGCTLGNGKVLDALGAGLVGVIEADGHHGVVQLLTGAKIDVRVQAELERTLVVMAHLDPSCTRNFNAADDVMISDDVEVARQAILGSQDEKAGARAVSVEVDQHGGFVGALLELHIQSGFFEQLTLNAETRR